MSSGSSRKILRIPSSVSESSFFRHTHSSVSEIAPVIAHFRMEDLIYREYMYCYLKNYHYDSLGSTSSISKAVNSKIIRAMPLVIPDYKLVSAFSKIVSPIFDQIQNKQKVCLELKQARDRLLPKLMSGELEV